MCPMSVHLVAREGRLQGRISDRRSSVSSMRAVFHRLHAKAADFRVGPTRTMHKVVNYLSDVLVKHCGHN